MYVKVLNYTSSALCMQANSDTTMNGTVWNVQRGRVATSSNVLRCCVTDLRHVGVTRRLLLASIEQDATLRMPRGFWWSGS